MIDLDAIEAEIDDAIGCADGQAPIQCSDAKEIITRLRKSEKDAARYRWLRDVAPELDFKSPLVIMADECGCAIEGYDFCGILYSDRLDSAIDEAMKCSK